MSRRPARPRVVFRVACGPRQGFGHLVRASRLATMLAADARCSIRGPSSVESDARALGLTPVTGGPRSVLVRPLDLLVVDDPSAPAARTWVRRARHAGIPVATIHDLGLGTDGADLAIDGSLVTRRGTRRGGIALTGPRFAIVGPEFLAERRRRPPKAHDVVIALGGGPRTGAAVGLALAIRRREPEVRVVIAAGLSPARRVVHDGIAWLDDTRAFPRTLASACVALVAGGVTLYESCVCGTPRVALAVVAAQRRTVAAFARRGAAVDAGGLPRTTREADVVAARVCALLRDAERRREQARRGRRLVDGRGVHRVSAALARLMAGRMAS